MNSGKKSTAIIVAVLAIIVVVVIVISGKGGNSTPAINTENSPTETTTPVPVSETTKVSSTLSEYKNDELGFSVKYPNTWEKDEANSMITFVIPLDKSQVSTIASLQANINVTAGTCLFPPLSSIKDRSKITVGDLSFNTITISNTVKDRQYYSRIYSLQNGDVCYMFYYNAISYSPATKNLKGSEATQANNNNRAIISASENDFIATVKSFKFVTGPQGIDETKAAPVK
ncbi:MAG: hypothetical protein M1459_02065 [Patescibacteria group bacterium]|nr:hypothetical protein [Patescibacteria group bacterium]